jgi:CrcB protein
VLLVGVGAFAGGVCRYCLGQWIAERFGPGFPLGTLLINASGSFALAFLVVLTADRLGMGPNLRLLLGVGFCGGYTTFSTFALESVTLFEARAGVMALAYILTSVLLCLLAAVAGGWLARLI